MAVEGVESRSLSDFYAEQAQRRQEQRDNQQASGQRIGSATDDAAGQQVTNRLTVEQEQAETLDRIYQNRSEQNEIESARRQNDAEQLADIQTYLVQTDNGIYNSDDIEALQGQVDANLDAIADSDALGLSQVDVSDPVVAQAAVSAAQTTVSGQSAALGAESNAQAAAGRSTQAALEAQSAARSRLIDTDYAQSTGGQAQDAVLEQVSLSVDKNQQSLASDRFNRLFNS